MESHRSRRTRLMSARAAYIGAALFDGTALRSDCGIVVCDGMVEAVVPAARLPASDRVTELPGGIIAPGCVDLQVNGGGGVMFNDDPSQEVLETIADAHAALGSTSILPTLITDTAETTRQATETVMQAVAAGMPGIAGLHLEGPHLAPARKGVHDPALIRPILAEDLEFLTGAARRLPTLLVTLAPESVTTAQVRALAEAGILVSLGHSDADFDACKTASENGARAVTHLFNAMSQLGSREPGLVGAALAVGDLFAGLIADMVHVHPETIAAALRAKRGPGQIFLVSDAMATTGSRIDHFLLNGRRIERRNGRLALADGTLAGADLDLVTAVRNVVTKVGLPIAASLAMATSVPARLIGQDRQRGRLAPGTAADFIWLDEGMNLAGVWRKGKAIV